MLQQEHWWDNLIWVVVFLFLIPSSLVVASWNSLPGSHLYRVKLFAEDAIVVLALSKEAKSELHVAYADRRLADATQMLVQSESADGLEYFRKQMEDAKLALAQAPDGSSKEELRTKYLAALQNASHQLEQQKQIISTTHNIPASAPVAAYVQSETLQERVVVREVTKVNYVTQVRQITQITQVIQQINQTQDDISHTIDEVQQRSALTVPTTPTPEAYATHTPTPIPTAIPTTTAIVTQADQPPPSFQGMLNVNDSQDKKNGEEREKNKDENKQEDHGVQN